ncbi:MAG: hypothetical protein L3J10_08575 [Sulfurimonas sp.]|nr:hypothetical protein [Sulfurimonas sp.]
MKKMFYTLLIGSALLNAQAIPGINSNGGAMTLPKGKLKVVIKHIQIKRDRIFDSTKEVVNTNNLDATAKVSLLALKYGVSDRLDFKLLFHINK